MKYSIDFTILKALIVLLLLPTLLHETCCIDHWSCWEQGIVLDHFSSKRYCFHSLHVASQSLFFKYRLVSDVNNVTRNRTSG